jgi:ribose transport system substrate-binding protein
MNKFCFIAIAGLAISVGAGCSNSSSSTSPASSSNSTPSAATPASNLTIAVIPKGTTHDYWKSVQAGAEQAGKDLGVTIEWKGPLQEDDRSSQISIVQDFTADKVSGIVLAPLDNAALVPPVKSAMSAKIPVVIIDSALNGTAPTDYVSTVSTDNFKGGVLGGQQLAKLLGGKGKVVLLRYGVGSASTTAREAGFLSVMAKNPGITVIEKDRYGGATAGEAKDASMQLVDKLKQANGVFTPNESTTVGMLLALQQENMLGKIKFVGFDSTPQLIDALNKGQIDALISQNPVKMGYEGVQTCVEKLRGQTVPTSIDTGVMEIDKSNINTPDVQKLLSGK